MIFNPYIKTVSNFDICKNIFQKSLKDFGSSLNPETEKAFDSLIKTMDKGFRGLLEPSFYLSPIDTGMGKSLCIKSFIKSLVINGSINESGILICLHTKAEIQSFINDCKLDRDLFSVLVYNDPLNNEGRGEAGRNEAPILFTTHQMVRSRSGSSFCTAKDFHYRGKPRNLRLWDESMLPAEPVSFFIDALSSLAAPLRPYEDQFVKELDSFLKTVGFRKSGEQILIPERLGEWASSILRSDSKGLRKLTDKQFLALEQVAKSAGMELTASQSLKTGKTLVGTVAELPADLTPAIIFDASGRLKETYNLWQKHRGNLVRLDPATNDYSNVTINLWKTGAGRDALEDDEKGRTIFRQVAKVIEAKADEPWLLVSFKPNDDLDPLEEVRSYLPDGIRIEFVHWGRHFAINDYADIKNIVVIGSWLYPLGTYKALYEAATGRPAGKQTTEDISRIRASEFQANLLQAFMRGHGRKSINGKAGECIAYVVASASPNPEPLIAAALPGCKMVEWSPIPKELTGQAKKVADYLLAQKASGAKSLSKSAVGVAVGIPSKQRRTTVFGSQAFEDWLKDNSIRKDGRRFWLSD